MRPVHVLLVCAAASAAEPSGAQGDSTRNVLGYELPDMERVRVTRALVYRAAGDAAAPRALTLDVYRSPALPAGVRRPVLVFVHGGLVAGEQGPPAADWPIYRSWGRLAAAAGFVGVTFNHRLTTNDNVAEGADDLSRLLGFVRSHAAALGADADRICVAIYSAGGPLASVLLRDRPPHIRCVVLFYPFLDLEHLRGETRFRRAHPAAYVDSLVPRYSPAHVIGLSPAALPPIFLAMAGRDQIPGLNGSIARFLQAAVEHRVRLDFFLHPEGEHGFDQRNHDARTREVIEQMLAFVRRHTGRLGDAASR